MNLHQIVRKARLNVDAIRTGNVASALWSDEEVVDAVNTAMDEAARIIRMADSRILTKTLDSSSSTSYGSGAYGAGSYGSEDLISETYSMFALAAETTDYLLPPDLVRIVSIRAVGTDFSSVVFRPMNAQDKYFLDQRSIPSDELSIATGTSQTFWYTQIGAFGIRFSPTPKEAIDLELVYDYRPPKLLYANTGTVNISNGSTALAGSSTTWFDFGLRTPAELMANAGFTTTRLDQYYPKILSIDSNTTATMARPWQSTALAGASYTLSMVPQLPPEHHAWLAEMTSAILMKKVNPDTAAKMKTDLEKQLKELVQPEVTTRQIQESIAVEPFEIQSL